MILTCPECASRFSVDAARLGPTGRVVRCSACNATWTAQPDPGEFAVAEPALPLAAPPELAAAAQSAEAPSHREPPLPNKLRAKAVEKRKTREAAATGAVWAALAASLAVVVLGAVLFRVDVVRLWPRTAGAYAFARLPVNPTGLALEGVKGEPGLSQGRVALRISGVERNIDNRPRAAAPLRVVLYDKGGQRLASQLAPEPAGDIAPGAARPFAAEFLDPPTPSASFVVEFAFDALRRPVRSVTRSGSKRIPLTAAASVSRATPEPVAPTIIPSSVQEAAPLPASSPYALPAAAAR